MKTVLPRVCTAFAVAVICALAGCSEQSSSEPESAGASTAHSTAPTQDNTAGPEVLAKQQPAEGKIANDTAAEARNASSTAKKAPPRAPAAGARTRIVNDPDNHILGWIYYDWSGVDPGLDTLTEKLVPPPGGKYNGELVNEFNRADMLVNERARLESLYASGKNVGTIVTNISSYLSAYDQGYGEFYLSAFSPGNVITFNVSYDPDIQKQYRGIDILFAKLSFANALDAYVWKVPPDRAAEIIAHFETTGNRRRDIYARAELKILGAEPAAALNDHVIETEIQSFALFTGDGIKLAEFKLK